MSIPRLRRNAARRRSTPPVCCTVVDDQAKLDVVSYILQTNGYPAGSTELKLDSPDLAVSQILKKGEQSAVQNFALVQTVGCLTRGADDKWLLTRTAGPLTTSADTPSAQAVVSASKRPLGTKTQFRVQRSAFMVRCSRFRVPLAIRRELGEGIASANDEPVNLEV